jgi:hypothetical protein
MKLRLVALAVSLTVVALLGIPLPRHVRITADQEEDRLERLVPPGTTLGQVIFVLDSLGLDHGRYDPAAHTLRAIDRRTSTTLLTSDNIRINLYFDADSQLVSRELKDIATATEP